MNVEIALRFPKKTVFVRLFVREQKGLSTEGHGNLLLTFEWNSNTKTNNLFVRRSLDQNEKVR